MSPKRSLMSMTGYGRAEGDIEGWHWAWQIRSVNGKGLDIRLRLPLGLEALETVIRTHVKQKLARGSVQVSLELAEERGAHGLTLNEHWLQTLIARADLFAKQYPDLKPASIDGLMRVDGVVSDSPVSSDPDEFLARNAAIINGLDQALLVLSDARRKEGDALTSILSQQMDEFEALFEQAIKCVGMRAERIKDDISTKLKEMLGDNLPQERLDQEAALLAIKMDIREEMDRLAAHLEQARSLLASGAPVGRKLDFLVQEFMREINTLCSKSSDIQLTQTGLAMKSLIEQFREQAANVE